MYTVKISAIGNPAIQSVSIFLVTLVVKTTARSTGEGELMSTKVS